MPSFWDPRRRPERPDTSRVTLIRFATEVDYPPFNFAGSDGNPTGFNVELARLICDELNVKRVEFIRKADQYIDYTVLPDLKRLGPRLGKRLPAVRKLLGEADAARMLSLQRTTLIEKMRKYEMKAA